MHTRFYRPTLLVIALLLPAAGCTSHAFNVAPISGPQSTPGTTAAVTTAGTASQETASSKDSSNNPRSTTSPSTTFTVLTGARCTAAVRRAAAAAAKLMPDGTKRTAQPTSTCQGDHLLEIAYPGSGQLAWTVRITITASTASGCQSAAGGASAHCGRVVGHPEMIGTDVVCGVSQCEQAWLFAGGYLVDVFGYLTGPGPIPMTSHGLPGVLPIGIDALAALTS